MQKINLDEFIDDMPFACSQYRTKIKTEILEFGKQLLELASENVEIEDIKEPRCDDHTPFWGACCSCGRYDNPKILVGHKVNKQSILDTIKQVE